MDPDDTSARSGRAKLAAVLGVAALAIPGGALATNALADSGSSSSSTAPAQQQIQDADPYAPTQESAPDGRDCPEEDGSGSGSSGESSESATGSGETAL